MRSLALALIALAPLSVIAGESAPVQPYPFWDGKETIAEYAERTGLEPTKTLDLGNGVKLELVLIPAGKFTMGTPEPESPLIGGAFLAAAGLVALVLLAVLVARSIRQRRWPQFSLRWLIALVAVLSVAQYGGFRCWRAVQASLKSRYSAPPVHEVTLPKPYYIGKYEVTQEQFVQIMQANPSRFKGRGLPVDRATWDDAQSFCMKASEHTGMTVRLPTEAEWEHACRAGTKTAYYCGDAETDLDSAGWYSKNSAGKTHTVGTKVANMWGLSDMHGNVCEWCEDDVHGDYRGAPSDGRAWVDAPRRDQRILRGGGWGFEPGGCRSASRICYSHESSSYFYGFRVVNSELGISSSTDTSP